MRWRSLSPLNSDRRGLPGIHTPFVPVMFRGWYRPAMSTKHVRSAADLARFRALLKIECAECGNAKTVDGFEAARLFGTKPFSMIRGRFKCSRCGARGASLDVLGPPPPRG